MNSQRLSVSGRKKDEIMLAYNSLLLYTCKKLIKTIVELVEEEPSDNWLKASTLRIRMCEVAGNFIDYYLSTGDLKPVY